MSKIQNIESAYIKKEIPEFHVGDTVRVMVKIPEAGDKMRAHPFEGVVISRSGSGINETFTMRKVSFGEGIERVFHLHSPSLERIEVIQSGKVRRSKLYYLRGKVGKRATKIKTLEEKA